MNVLDAPISAPISASKSQILDAAAECFMEHGVNVASIDDIARRLGSTKGRIYHHFPSKDALVSHVLRQGRLINYQAVAPVRDPSLPADQNFHNMARMHIETVLRNMSYFKVFVSNWAGESARTPTHVERELQESVRDVTERYENLFRDVLREGMETGVFRRQNISVALHSVLVLLNAPVIWYAPGQPDSQAFRDQVIDQLAEMALKSLK